jgi:glycosyltransferase involved in cell wall biosynthesis
VDAVTNQALAFREHFSAWGWGGHDVAESIDPRMDGRVRPLRTLSPDPGDVLLVHYSAYAPRLRSVLDLPVRKLLLSHNVTPARWFWDHEPAIAVRCALGRKHLAEFIAASDAVAAVSRYNADELEAAGGRDPAVIPILFDPARLGAAGTEREPVPGAPSILFVGRLAPHKRQDEAIRAVALLRSHRAPNARLVLVGEPLNDRYLVALRRLADEVAPGAVTFRSGLSSAELAECYRSADLFLCLSEHEGFCVPLLESFHFGLPVLARPVGGVPEVAGDAALLCEDEDLAVVAELAHLATTDPELRRALSERGRQRLERFSPETTAASLREALEAVARV